MHIPIFYSLFDYEVLKLHITNKIKSASLLLEFVGFFKNNKK